MGNPIQNWLRSLRFKAALNKGHEQEAEKIFREMENSGLKLSALAKLYQKKQQVEESLTFYKRELASVSNRTNYLSKQEVNYLEPDAEFVNAIRKSFNFLESESGKIQCSGVESEVIPKFEASLANFLDQELQKIPKNLLEPALQLAVKEIEALEEVYPVKFQSRLSPYIYFLNRFPQEVYSNYLACFLVYQSGLIPQNIKILDLNAGVGSTIYGLFLLLQSSINFSPLPPVHISYYSLEKNSNLQFRGLQFWHKYIEPQPVAANIYLRFDTTDLLSQTEKIGDITPDFFDLIVLAHSFFETKDNRLTSHHIYKEIIHKSLADNGHVLLVINQQKLSDFYDLQPSEDTEQQENLIHAFVQELGLQLKWYRYLSSMVRGEEDLQHFSAENLSSMTALNSLRQKYLEHAVDSNYVIDDYVILAQKKSQE